MTVVAALCRPVTVLLLVQSPATLKETALLSNFGSTPELITTLKNWVLDEVTPEGNPDAPALPINSMVPALEENVPLFLKS